MLFNSLVFLAFLPLAFGAYWALNRSLRLQNLLVIAASYVFYGWWDWRFLGLIAFTSAWSYATGVLELRRWNEPKGSRLLLVLSLVVNLGILGYFKYCGFFVESARALLAALGLEGPGFATLDVVLPVGISFYTFQALSYTIDVYRRNIVPTKDPVAFFAFISFFPQLVAGPIERATNLLPQFLAPRRFDHAQAVLGCRQMLWGFFKKMVVADNCATLANGLLNNGLPANGLALWTGVAVFAVQIYGDFSGYSDIAIGCARLFGVKLMRNFDCPYFARDIAEYWRRWHISLTTWFRDYLYIPLGGSRGGRLMKIRNTFAIFLVSGFWHGANWTFVLWGAFHAFLFLPMILRGTNRRHLDIAAADRALPSVRELGAMLLTFALVTCGFVLFRAPDVGTALAWFRGMFDPTTFASAFPKLPSSVGTVCGATAFLFAAEWFNRREGFGFARLPPNAALRRLVYFGLLAAILFLTPGGANFIYFQF